jgi:hypothetical protein
MLAIGIVVLVLFKASIPNRVLSMKEPPMTFIKVSAPLINTPEPIGSEPSRWPLWLAFTLFNVTVPASLAVMEIPFISLYAAVTLVSVTLDAKISIAFCPVGDPSTEILLMVSEPTQGLVKEPTCTKALDPLKTVWSDVLPVAGLQPP